MIENIKRGDVVTRNSYNNDLLFKVENINSDLAMLKGMTVRIVADAKLSDLRKVDDDVALEELRKNEEKSRNRISRNYNRLNYYKPNNFLGYNTYTNVIKEDLNEFTNPNILATKQYKIPGVILHLDGDKEYTDKCKMMYQKMGLESYVYYIPETEQSKYVYNLLEKIKPNILILTGHDALSKKSNDKYNINNYKNSKYYIESIKEARRFEHNLDSLVIYAGACQSYYEALITAGANFASSPKRVLIDIMDPIIVAQTVAYTSVDKYISLAGTISNTREGAKGIGGVQTRGQCREGLPSFR